MELLDIEKKRYTVRSFADTPLEAENIDVGSAWISYFDKEKARQLLNIPENWVMTSLLYLGYPSEDSRPNTKTGGKRKELSETCFEWK